MTMSYACMCMCVNICVCMMLFSEYLRATNTGKLVLLSSANARLFIYGLEDHEEKLAKLLAEDPKHSLVLFPGADSLTTTQFLTRFQTTQREHTTHTQTQEQELPSTKTHTHTQIRHTDTHTHTQSYHSVNVTPESKHKANVPVPVPRLTIVVLDGTWRQAKRIQATINKNISHVRVSPIHKPLFNALRKQSQPDRVSTIEALVMFLQGIGTSEEISDSLLKSLRICVDMVTLQKHGKKTSIHNSFSEDQVMNIRRAYQREALMLALKRKRTDDQQSSNGKPAKHAKE